MASLPWGKSEDVPCAQDRAGGGTVGYEVGSPQWGQGEDVPRAQGGGFGETRERKAGSPLWDKDVPHAWCGSQEVTLPESLCPGARPDLLFTSPATPGPWRGHVGRGSGPARGKELHTGGERPPTATERQCSHP